MRNLSKETIGLLILAILLGVTGCRTHISDTEQVVELACQSHSPTGKGISNIHIRGVIKVKIVEGSCQVVRLQEQQAE